MEKEKRAEIWALLREEKTQWWIYQAVVLVERFRIGERLGIEEDEEKLVCLFLAQRLLKSDLYFWQQMFLAQKKCEEDRQLLLILSQEVKRYIETFGNQRRVTTIELAINDLSARVNSSQPSNSLPRFVLSESILENWEDRWKPQLRQIKFA